VTAADREMTGVVAVRTIAAPATEVTTHRETATTLIAVAQERTVTVAAVVAEILHNRSITPTSATRRITTMDSIRQQRRQLTRPYRQIRHCHHHRRSTR
jgi:hypothetical protein